MRAVLIDTDVFLDVLFAREPFLNDSAKILDLCAQKKLKGYSTAVMFANMYYILRKANSHKKICAKLEVLLEFTEILEINKADILTNIQSGFLDFEDGLQYQAALRSKKIEAIITRNVKDFKNSKISVFSPTTFLT